jgi:hypothetical protein
VSASVWRSIAAARALRMARGTSVFRTGARCRGVAGHAHASRGSNGRGLGAYAHADRHRTYSTTCVTNTNRGKGSSSVPDRIGVYWTENRASVTEPGGEGRFPRREAAGLRSSTQGRGMAGSLTDESENRAARDAPFGEVGLPCYGPQEASSTPSAQSVPVGTPCGMDGEWCRKELKASCRLKNGNDGGNVIER